MTAEKTTHYMRTQLAGGLFLKNLKYFGIMLNIFDLSPVWQNVESWTDYPNKVFWIVEPYISTDVIKGS